MTVEYQVTVSTEDVAFAGTIDDVYITLVGQDGSSEQVKLDKSKSAFHRGDESTFTVTCSEDLGQLLEIQLEKWGWIIIKDSWLPAKVEVESPDGKVYSFPIYHWLTDSKKHFFREGAAVLDFQETNPQMIKTRKNELKNQKNLYRWAVYKEGIPLCMEADTLKSLPPDDRYPYTRELEFNFTAVAALGKLGLEAWSNCIDKWNSMRDIEQLYECHVTSMSDYAMKHWREDAFFGYQFLNGVNPMMIQRCKTLPSKFPVPLDMNFSKSQLTLRTEMMKGNIFLCDYNILDGVETNTINGRKQFLAAPLVLLHKNEDDEMMPIAIQLKQEPGEDNPIFFPTDSEYDWLLAKTYVKSADSNLHELNYHLLRTHLLAEVFAVSLQRNLPRVHPVYKLLIRHTRYTLQINVLARNSLISESGTITLYTASGGKGMLTLLDRSVSSMSYRSLCIPDDIIDRGLEDVPNFYYRDDGLKLWNIMQRFVHGILSFYYKTDCMVQNDAELQNWIQEIFENGFLRCNETGIPQKFTTVAELVKFVTMVMFTCSAQHAAVNTGQYDLYGWMPNGPSTMQEPPPTHKGKADEASFLSTLPDVQTTVHILATVWLLSMQSSDARYLHDFVEEHFTEDFPKYKVTTFQRDLIKLSEDIKDRNENLKLPYTFLDPKLVENSVAI
ncbi:arachidonate 8S-lipoxygenase-like [Oryzias latipes]|uniref:arachidonate 8S-lipoxygenase-like n=1 Tax=Oryzias latipes TaxID=8090 RepID=UPI000CE1761B|nr:arachidonate 8S-lipoxygenase-like [Oryzias latipes]